MQNRLFVGGPWDGSEFEVPETKQFRVLMQVSPSIAAHDRPFRYGTYERCVRPDGSTFYVWNGLEGGTVEGPGAIR